MELLGSAPVISRILESVSAPRLSRVCVALSSRASASPLGSRSTAMIGSQPAIRPPPRGWRASPACPPLRDRKFADSLLEGEGFEPSVPVAETILEETASARLRFGYSPASRAHKGAA